MIALCFRDWLVEFLLLFFLCYLLFSLLFLFLLLIFNLIAEQNKNRMVNTRSLCNGLNRTDFCMWAFAGLYAVRCCAAEVYDAVEETIVARSHAHRAHTNTQASQRTYINIIDSRCTAYGEWMDMDTYPFDSIHEHDTQKWRNERGHGWMNDFDFVGIGAVGVHALGACVRACWRNNYNSAVLWRMCWTRESNNNNGIWRIAVFGSRSLCLSLKNRHTQTHVLVYLLFGTQRSSPVIRFFLVTARRFGFLFLFDIDNSHLGIRLVYEN